MKHGLVLFLKTRSSKEVGNRLGLPTHTQLPKTLNISRRRSHLELIGTEDAKHNWCYNLKAEIGWITSTDSSRDWPEILGTWKVPVDLPYSPVEAQFSVDNND